MEHSLAGLARALQDPHPTLVALYKILEERHREAKKVYSWKSFEELYFMAVISKRGLPQQGHVMVRSTTVKVKGGRNERIYIITIKGSAKECEWKFKSWKVSPMKRQMADRVADTHGIPQTVRRIDGQVAEVSDKNGT